MVTANIRMPVMDGLTATALTRERFPDVQVVILTAYPDEAFRREAMAAGAAAYLVKSQPCEDLIPTLRSAVAKGRTV